MDSALILTATAGAFLLAGFVKGVIGLGLPTVSIGLLGLLMTPAQAAAILVVPSLVTNVWQAVVGGGVMALARRLWPMLVGICAGTFAGAVLLPHDDSGRATVWLGLALVIYAALGLVKVHFSVPPRSEVWLGLLMGAATGAITVATGIFVMPGTPYVQSLQFDRDKMVQALGLSFTVSTITLALALAYAGQVKTVACLGLRWWLLRCAGRDVARAIGARQSAGGNLPVVFLPRVPVARRDIWRCAGSCDRLGCVHEKSPGPVQ